MPEKVKTFGYSLESPKIFIDVTMQSTQEKKERSPRKMFSEDEDALLRSVIEEKLRESPQEGAAKSDPLAWDQIMKILNAALPVQRTARQYKERWVHYLQPAAMAMPFAPAEDQLLWATYSALGPKWKAMESKFPGRTYMSLKNRFKVLIRRSASKKPEPLVDAESETEPAPVAPPPPVQSIAPTRGEEETQFDDFGFNEIYLPIMDSMMEPLDSWSEVFGTWQ
jgi:hypothetical protein